MIYVSGHERRMYIDENGVTKETAFWGQKKRQSLSWDEISDARIILNKGRKIYAIFTEISSCLPSPFCPSRKRN